MLGVPEVSGVSEANSLVSLVSVQARNWCYLCGKVEKIAEGDVVEIANIHAIFVHVAENIVGCEKDPSEYPTLSAISADFPAFESVVSISTLCAPTRISRLYIQVY